MKEKKPRLNAAIPESLSSAIDKNMIEEGYSKRKKSKWVEEALKELLASINNNEDKKKQLKYSKKVETASQIYGNTKIISIYIKAQLKHELACAILIVRKYYPGLELVKSLIIKASIVNRLFTYDKLKKNI